MAHPATSGTAYTVLATLIQLKGEDAVWDYLAELNKNMSQYTKSGSAAPNGVALGEAAIALTFSHDGLQPTTEGYPIELSFPTDGTGYEVGAMALIKGGPADEQENAKKFIDFVCNDATAGVEAVKTSSFFPVHSDWGDVYADAEDADLRAPFALMSNYLGRYYTLTGGWTEQRALWWPMLQAVMGTGADVQTAADDYVAQANAGMAG